jgi:site-specific DNA-methyltransferase (adenine-specific)
MKPFLCHLLQPLSSFFVLYLDPHYKVESLYYEKIRLYLVFNRSCQRVTKEINLRVLDDSNFATHCHRAWTSMRILCTFSLPQIVICSEIEQSIAEEFVYQLYQIGYLQLVECCNKNLIGSENVYRLCINSGPLAPFICADGIVYDLNSRKFYMTQ